MTDISQETPRKVSITFERKMEVSKYENVVARAWVEGSVAHDADPLAVSNELADLFAAAAAAVYDQLGVKYTVGDDGIVRETEPPKVVTETIKAAFPGSTEVTDSDGGPQTGVRILNAKDAQGAPDPWLVDQCIKLGITAVWDRRKQNAGTRKPLYEEAVRDGERGHGKGGEAKKFWAPGTFD